MGFIENTNRKVAASPVGRWFRLEGSGHVSHREPLLRPSVTSSSDPPRDCASVPDRRDQNWRQTTLVVPLITDRKLT